jgi:hypothetical protein
MFDGLDYGIGGNDSPTTATSAPRAPAHATTRGNDDDSDFGGDF